VPLVAFEVVISGGAAIEPLEQKGLSSLLASLMNEGTASRSAAEFEQAVGLLGSSVTVSSGNEELVISATSLSRNFEETVALVEEVLFSPRFEQPEFERVRSALITSVTGLEANPAAIANFTLNSLLYGNQHPRGTTLLGRQEAISALTLEDVRSQYGKQPGMLASIHIAGDVSDQRASAAFGEIAAFFNEPDESLPEYPIAGSNSGVYFVDVPGSAQSVLMLGQLTVPTGHPDANQLRFANEKLGGGISGDLAQTLRIEKGYTYGASSGFGQGLEVQPFLVQTSVRANATGDSLAIIRDMLTRYGPEFSAADAQMTQQKIIKANTRAFESLGGLLNTLRMIGKFGKSTRFVEEEQEELLAMTPADYRAIVAEYLPEDEMAYVIVGDKATQFGPVTEFAGGGVIELDVFGRLVESD